MEKPAWNSNAMYLYTGRNNPLFPLQEYDNRIVHMPERPPTGHNDHKMDHHKSDRHSRNRKKRHHRHKGHRKKGSKYDQETENERSAGNRSLEELLKRRDEMTGCHQFLRYATTLFTFIVFLAGAGILGLGIYILGSDYGAKQMSEVLGNDLYQIAAYVLIVSGVILVLISFCGCCGAMRESRVLLGIFIFAISTLIVALVAAAAMVFVFRQKMEGDIIHSMEDVLLQKYGVDLQGHSENRVVTDMWNWLQRETDWTQMRRRVHVTRRLVRIQSLKCCGVTGNVNSTTSWAIYKRSAWYQGFITGRIYVPESCCARDGDINICTGVAPINGPPMLGPPVTANMVSNPYLNTVGCYDELVHYIQDHAVIIGVSSIATVVVMLFGLFFAVYLCRRVSVLYY